MRVTYLAAARRDLSEIWRYSSDRWDPHQADRYVRKIASAVAEIASGSVKGRAVDGVAQEFRRHSVGSHVIIFRFAGSDGVEVVRIMHQRMDLGRFQ